MRGRTRAGSVRYLLGIVYTIISAVGVGAWFPEHQLTDPHFLQVCTLPLDHLDHFIVDSRVAVLNVVRVMRSRVSSCLTQ